VRAGAPARARTQIHKLNAIKVALTLRKLGIDHVKGTIVGNDLVLRARARPARTHTRKVFLWSFCALPDEPNAHRCGACRAANGNA
jgi:hypothetical protein